MNINFSVNGLENVTYKINKIKNTVDDLNPALIEVGKKFYQIENTLFNTKGGSGAQGAWAPLSQRYAEYKSKRFGSKPLMVATGELKKSLTTATNRNSVYILSNKNTLEIGTKTDYAQYHQNGTKKMPQRKLIDLKDNQFKSMVKAIKDYIFKGL